MRYSVVFLRVGVLQARYGRILTAFDQVTQKICVICVHVLYIISMCFGEDESMTGPMDWPVSSRTMYYFLHCCSLQYCPQEASVKPSRFEESRCPDRPSDPRRCRLCYQVSMKLYQCNFIAESCSAHGGDGVKRPKTWCQKVTPSQTLAGQYMRCWCPPCLIGPLGDSSGRAPTTALPAGARISLLSGFSGPSCVNVRPRRRLTRSRGLIQPSLIAEDSQSMKAARPRPPTAVL